MLLLVLFGSILIFQSNQQFEWNKGKNNHPLIYSDGAAYYMYLPQWFIYKTNNFEFKDEIKNTYSNERFIEMLNYDEKSEKYYNKFYPGTAIILSPFFLLAHFLASLFGFIQDGYSYPYQISVAIAAIFCCLLGIFYVFKSLEVLAFNNTSKVIAVFSILFGTNLHFYTLYAPSFSHVYSFMVNSAIIYYALLLFRNGKNKYLPLISFLIGLAFIIRPTNILIIIIFPFLMKHDISYKIAFNKLFKSKKTLILSLFMGAIPLLLHYINTYYMFGSFTSYTYGNEGFSNWKNPQIHNMLFSYKKGLFIYSPVLIFSVIGFFLTSKNKFSLRRIRLGAILLLLIFTYISSSWWNWWYGGGLGMRIYIEYLFFFALGFSLLFNHSKKALKLFMLLPIFFGVFIYQTYSYQYNNHILHYDQMNKALFWKLFLKTDKRFEYYSYQNFETIPSDYSTEVIIPFENKYEVIEQNWITLLDYNYEDDPFLSYSPKSDSAMFACKVSMEIKTKFREYKPYFNVDYTLKDGTVKSKKHYIGGQISKIKTPQKINFDLYPEIKNKGIEKITLTFRESSPHLEVRNMTATIKSRKQMTI